MRQVPLRYLLGLIAVALVFQLFFRYQYVRLSDSVLRVDRLTAQSCYMPCVPASPTPMPTNPFDNLWYKNSH